MEKRGDEKVGNLMLIFCQKIENGLLYKKQYDTPPHFRSFLGIFMQFHDVKTRQLRQIFLNDFNNLLVGATGFEPATFCSRSKRATRLRHTPN